MRRETVTMVLVNLAGMVERADESLLPGVYKEVGAAVKAGPTGLGALTMLRSGVQSACYPVAAYMAARHNRAHVVALGAFLWSAATLLVGISTTFLQVAISRALNGVGLALVAPAIQSLVADSTHHSNRGAAFGFLHLTANLGSVLGGLCSILLAPSSLFGLPGWRLSFLIVGLLSVAVGLLVGLYATDPRLLTRAESGRDLSFWSGVRELVREGREVVSVRSFQIIVAQGVTGSFPWSALSFAPMWLELAGFSHRRTAFLVGLFVVSSSLGGLFGGVVGDALAARLPNPGRIIMAQISSASAIPLAAVLLLALPVDSSTGIAHGLVLFVMGFCISWNAPATNNPIFAEIVPERARTSVYALDRSFESVLASFAPPIVGLLAQHVYGYKPIPKGSSVSEEIAMDKENAGSLAKALYTAIGVPMALCCLIYSFLYSTYPRDRERARMEALIESEMATIESQNLTAEGRYSQVEDVSNSVEPCLGSQAVMELDREALDSMDFDESDEDDEKTLLYRQLTFANLSPE